MFLTHVLMVICLASARSIRAKQYVVMGHDYNLPFGPWGMEVDPEMPLGKREVEVAHGF